MDLSNKPLCRTLCAEPLESRWLLSGTAPPGEGDPPATADSTIDIEWERAAEEEEDGDVVISPSDLPKQVLAAFNARFADATITKVELEEEEEGTQYGIEAEQGDQEIDVTLSPSGEILETETFIDETDVPQALLDAIQKQYPDADIVEAATLETDGVDGVDGYEILITDADGIEWEGETGPLPSSTSPVEETPEGPSLPAGPLPDTFAQASDPDASPETEFPAAADEAAPQEQQAVAQDDSAGAAETASREDAIERNAIAAAARTTTLANDPSDRISQALDALAAGAGAAVWLPEVAGALIDVLPINIDDVEQGFGDMLDKFAALSGKVKPDSALGTGVSRIAMAATLVAAVKMLLNHSRKSSGNGGPALVFGPADSSWGWVLGTTAPKRRRVLSRQSEP